MKKLLLILIALPMIFSCGDNLDKVITDKLITKEIQGIEVLTKEGLAIELDFSVRYTPIAEKIKYLHKEIGKDYFESFIKPEILAITREVMENNKIYSNELFTAIREDFNKEIFQRTRKTLKSKNIILYTLLITDIKLPKSVMQAILRMDSEQGLIMDGIQKYHLNNSKEEQERIARKEYGFKQTYVPDDNFEQVLINKGFDHLLDDSVTTVNINTVTSLSLWGRNISDLTGIEDFTALTYLQCVSNQLTSLDVSANTALIELACYDNKLTYLDVSANTVLEGLECGDNQLTSLDVSSNPLLFNLLCSNNQLTSLDVSNNIDSLTILYCEENQLTSLDVSANTALTDLKCRGNKFDCDALKKKIGLD